MDRLLPRCPGARGSRGGPRMFSRSTRPSWPSWQRTTRRSRRRTSRTTSLRSRSTSCGYVPQATVYPPRTVVSGALVASLEQELWTKGLSVHTRLSWVLTCPVAAHPVYPFSGAEHTHLRAISLTFYYAPTSPSTGREQVPHGEPAGRLDLLRVLHHGQGEESL